MINIIAIDNLRSIPFSAKLGFSLISYYAIAALLFFIPTALVAAELATAWPIKEESIFGLEKPLVSLADLSPYGYNGSTMWYGTQLY